MRHVGFETAPNQPFKVYASVLTEMFKRDPSLEASIVLEQRGDFFNSFFNYEIQLDTLSVRNLVGIEKSYHLFYHQRTIFCRPPQRLQNKKVFFVKNGFFNPPFKKRNAFNLFILGVVVPRVFPPGGLNLLEYLLNPGISFFFPHFCFFFISSYLNGNPKVPLLPPTPLNKTYIFLKFEY